MLPPGPLVYRQPELFTSATGPDVRHGHPDGGPAPAAPPCHPRGFAGKEGKEGSGLRAESRPYLAPHPTAGSGPAELLSLLAPILEIWRTLSP